MKMKKWQDQIFGENSDVFFGAINIINTSIYDIFHSKHIFITYSQRFQNFGKNKTSTV